MFLLGISENKETRKEFAIYRSNVVVPTGPGFFFPERCYEPGSTMLKKRDVIEAKLKV